MDKIYGYGALLFPYCFIGNDDEWKSFRSQQAEYINNRYLISNNENVKQLQNSLITELKITNELSYLNYIIKISRYGLITIIKPNKEIKKNTAIKILNTILAFLSYYSDIPFFSVNETDILKVSYYEDGRVGSMQGSSNTSKAILDWQHMKIHKLDQDFRINLSISFIENIITKVENYQEYNNLCNQMRLFLKVNEFIYKNEYDQAFLLSFIIIESHLKQEFDRKLEELLIKKEIELIKVIMDKFKRPTYWTLDHIIEFFHLSEEITANEYKDLIKLKKIRNKFVHGLLKKEISKEETDLCINLSKEILNKVITKINDK